jgi:hypothetical protein
MFDDYWRIHYRSQDSAGKRTVKIKKIKDQKLSENTQKFLFAQKMEVARRRGRGEPPGAHTTLWSGLGLDRTTRWCGLPGPPLASPLRVYHLPENLRLGRGSQIDSAASAGQKTHTQRKLSGRQKSTGEIPSRRGEIIAIVTAIELGFIGIVITIATSSCITIITTPSRYNILG